MQLPFSLINFWLVLLLLASQISLNFGDLLYWGTSRSLVSGLLFLVSMVALQKGVLPAKSLLLSIALVLFVICLNIFQPLPLGVSYYQTDGSIWQAGALANNSLHPFLSTIAYVLGVNILYQSHRFVAVTRAFGLCLLLFTIGKIFIFEVVVGEPIVSNNQDAMGLFLGLLGFLFLRNFGIQSYQERVIALSIVFCLVGLIVSLSSIKFFIASMLLTIAFMQNNISFKVFIIPLMLLFVITLFLLDVGDWRRIPAGVTALLSLESNTNYSGADQRIEQILFSWSHETLTIFGNGLEAFRADTGSTGHSFLADVVYNFGLLGTMLFTVWIFVTVIQHCTLTAYYMALLGGVFIICVTSNAYFHPGFMVVVAASFGVMRRSVGDNREQ